MEHIRTTLFIAVALVSAVSCPAQNSSFSSDPADMTLRAQTCADERESPEDRMRACTALIKDGGLTGRDLANIYLYRARAARAAAEDDSAARDLDLAIRADDRYPLTYFERANFRSASGEKRLALEDYDRAIRLKKSHPEFFINRGNTYKDLGDHNAAIADYSAAIKLDPRNAAAWFNRSLVYARLGQRDLAAQDRARALKLDPTLR